MELWLDGQFWGKVFRKEFISEVELMRRSIFEHMLPSFPDPVAEREKVIAEAEQAAIAECLYDLGDYAEWAQDEGLKAYFATMKMRQSAVNLAATMLRHLLEQQMKLFHTRQVLLIAEEQMLREDPKTIEDQKKRNKLSDLSEFHWRLQAGGCPMTDLAAWPMVDELRLVANVVKHGSGGSLDDLFKIRPDLLNPPGPAISTLPGVKLVDVPAAGEDLFVRDEDLARYFDAAVQLWTEFAEAVEAHSEKHRGGR